MSSVRGVLFDLDGTLVNSAPDIANAAQHMLSQLDLPPVHPKAIEKWVGNGLPQFIKRVLTGEMEDEPDPSLFQRATPIFLDFYQENVCVDSHLYSGATELLQALTNADLKLAIVTNKANNCTIELLKQIGIHDYFSSIICGDTCENKKPHPQPIQLALQQLDLVPEETLMVGDSAHDVNAANAAGIPALVVDYGYAQGVNLSTLNTLAVISELNEISNFV
ncbi:MAG: phosphoglycolate phosphatase [Saprospiraceae bacterium]